MKYNLSFNPQANLTQMPADAIEPGHVFVDTTSDGTMVNVVALKCASIRNSENVRIFGFVPEQSRFTTFKLQNHRTMDVLGFVDTVSMEISDIKNAEPVDSDETEVLDDGT